MIDENEIERAALSYSGSGYGTYNLNERDAFIAGVIWAIESLLGVGNEERALYFESCAKRLSGEKVSR